MYMVLTNFMLPLLSPLGWMEIDILWNWLYVHLDKSQEIEICSAFCRLADHLFFAKDILFHDHFLATVNIIF